MKKVYFVRHSKPDFSVMDDSSRPLTNEGLKDCKKVTNYLINKNIDKIYSSPFKRSYDTIKDFAEKANLPIHVIDDFRERKISNEWIDDFDWFVKKQWSDFSYKLKCGENLREVQHRNIKALKDVIADKKNDNIVIATHGTALSTIINYYDPSFHYEKFLDIKNLMPFIVEIEFEGKNFVSMSEIILQKV